MKRPNPNFSEMDGPRKRNRGNDETVRLLIPSKIAGAVIGKSGQNINRLRSQYKATVTVDDCQGPERTVLISSSMDAVCGVIADILKSFEGEQDGEIDLRVLIHHSLAGCVIGKSGSKIKELREKIGSRIKIFSNTAPQSSDRVIQILGKPEHCIASIQEIVSLVKGTPIRGPVNLYDPINFDEVFADDYGGYGGGGGGSGGRGGGGGGGSNGRNRDGNRMPDRGGRERFDRDDDRRGGNDIHNGRQMMMNRSCVEPWANAPPPALNAGPENKAGDLLNFLPVAAAAAAAAAVAANGTVKTQQSSLNYSEVNNIHIGNGYSLNVHESGLDIDMLVKHVNGQANGHDLNGTSDLLNAAAKLLNGNAAGGGSAPPPLNGGGNGKDPSVSTTQVTIPKDLAGAIIGKAGGRIRRIRSESSAFITIDEPLPGSSDRIITITGNPKQIQTAQYLLQQSVHENRKRF